MCFQTKLGWVHFNHLNTSIGKSSPGYNNTITKIAIFVFLLRNSGNVYLFVPGLTSTLTLLPSHLGAFIKLYWARFHVPGHISKIYFLLCDFVCTSQWGGVRYIGTGIIILRASYGDWGRTGGVSFITDTNVKKIWPVTRIMGT